MCGICGIISFQNREVLNDELLRRMNQSLFHRGPDDQGYYRDNFAALGMRRLSIIDLEMGQQPISNEDGSVWVIYNGEIYNYRELRAQLETKGHIFKTHSDTEVIVHAYEEYGQDCVQHFNGMFAIAIWERSARRLVLMRDRLGVKPLFYWVNGGNLVFGSELKAVIAHTQVSRQLDFNGLDNFLSLEYIPGPRTIFKDVQKLAPGHLLVFQESGLKLRQYWDLPYRPLEADEHACSEALADLIQEAVRIRMVSDVPLGAFLSGGIDSSSIVAYMSQMSSQPVQTFSIGFEDDTYNELPDAQIAADHFGAHHRTQILSPDITGLAEKLVYHLDEPMADFSIFPTFLVSQLASRSVKVVLSGDGGDELFAGYDTYIAESLSRYYQWLPRGLRQNTLPSLVNRIPPQPAKKGFINKTKRMVEGGALEPSLHHARWMIFLSNGEKASLYHPDLRGTLNGYSTNSIFEGYFNDAALFDPLAQQQYVDIKTYLPDDILAKVDRMSMAASIEARVPLLDYRIAEFALNLPPEMKLHRSRTKVILRRAMQKLLPEIALTKPKQGFSIPMKHWLRSSLRPMLQDLLSEECVRQRGYFNPPTVSAWVREHLDGRANHSHRLWALMVFELWHRSVVEA
jgi:asparagine synthase (glutamine-hydrolysing)